MSLSFTFANSRHKYIFLRRDGFDGIFNLMSSFGYFDDPDDDLRVLKNIHQSLKKDGVFCLDVGGREVIARGFPPRSWELLDDKSLLLEEHLATNYWSRIEDHWILIKDGQRREYRSAHRVYSALELVAILKESGFSRVACFGDFDGSPYDHNARRLVLVARTLSENSDRSEGKPD